jgi:hypothetical protein
MEKPRGTTIASGTTGSGAPTAGALDPVMETAGVVGAGPVTATPDSPPKQEQIARLAYSYWQARGCPEGSPDEDWLRAEADLGRQAGGMGA